MHVYIASKLTGATDEDLEVYDRMADACRECGIEAYLPHKDTGSRNDLLDPRDVFVKNIEALQNSMAVIAEVSKPSFGVGMECEYSLRSAVPVIPVARKGSDVSRMLLGHPAVEPIIYYQSQADLTEKLMRRLALLERPPSSQGLFVVIEGTDGSGKNTLVRDLYKYFHKKTPSRTIRALDDPNPSEFWEAIWSAAKAKPPHPISNAMVLLAARIDQTENDIMPTLSENGIVFANRFHDSWLIYQAERLRRRLSIDAARIDYFLNLSTAVTRSIKSLPVPDHVFILVGDPVALRARVEKRGTPDEEYEAVSFQEVVRDKYVDLYQKNSKRMTLVDTTRRSPKEVFQLAKDYLEQGFGI